MTDKWDSCVLLAPTSPILWREKKKLFIYVDSSIKRRITLGEKKSNFGSVFYVPFYVCNVKYKLNDPEWP